MATDGDLPLGSTLRTDAQSVQRLDQAKFQIKAVATMRIIFLVQKLKRVGRDFTPPVPETFAMVDGR
jgi:hypothetical protein